MAYFRTLKSGERRLIYTAKDRRIQRERRKQRFRGPLPHITAIHDPLESYSARRWNRRDIEHFWWWHYYEIDEMQHAVEQQRESVRKLQCRTLLTLKRERRRISPQRAWSGDETITLNGETRAVKASPGYVATDRWILAKAQATLRNMEMALALYADPNRRQYMRHIGGKPYRAPYVR